MTSKLVFERENMQKAMYRISNIRNMSVIAHVDHGKSTLTDALVCKAGLIPENQSGEKRWTDSLEDEIERGITIKSTSVSMLFNIEENDLLKSKLESLENSRLENNSSFLVNLIDSPGHVDFSSEVTAALRVTDGALVVVDVVSGVSNQTETVLRQALNEQIKPVLVINKLDRAILEQKLEPEELYLRLQKIIEQVNHLIYMYSYNEDEEETSHKHKSSTNNVFKCAKLDPIKGNVAFAAGKDGWAFTLTKFVDIWNKKKQITSSNILKRLWGDNFYNPIKNKWQSTIEEENGQIKLKRGFCQYILEPIYKMLHVCIDNNVTELESLCSKLNFKFNLRLEEKELFSLSGGKELMKHFMKKWLPAADALLELIIYHLPSPIEAQKYRVDHLYEGPLDDQAAIGMRECDANGPLMIYISKMIPDSVSKTKFYAFGRVFSGTAEPNMKVRIMSPDYKIGSENGLYLKNLTNCVAMIGDKPLGFDSIPAGNIIALSGIDTCLLKSGTITTFELAHNIRSMKFSVSPVVRIAVDPVNPNDLNKFVEGLKKLCRSDQLVQVEMDNGQHIIAGAGELHLEVIVKDLEKLYAKVPIKVSEPIVTYKESVLTKSSQDCLAKSQNKHNRIYMTAEPLTKEFCEDIDTKKIHPNLETKERNKYMHDVHNFDLAEARKIWCFGPNQFDSNILIDMTKGVASSNDVSDAICAGFQWGSLEGPLCGESLRGVRFNITDLEYHRDPAHRKGAQLIPTTRRAMMSSMLSAKPCLLEPVYMVEIQCPESVVGSVYNLLNRKRGEIIDDYKSNSGILNTIKAYLPVNESQGFTRELSGATSGKAFPQCFFDHWQLLPGDPYDLDSKAGQVTSQIRKVKNLREQLPLLTDYLDRL